MAETSTHHRDDRVVLGTCHHDCPDTCGWQVTVREEALGPVAVSLRGNREHPTSKGELCPKVNRFLDRVYHPQRLLHPLVRTGPKGSRSFRRASWDEALEVIATRWRDIIDTWGGEAILPWSSAGTQGLLQGTSLDRRFFARLGASRPLGSMCGLAAGAGMEATTGSRRGSDPFDVRHARLVLLWGTNTKVTNRHLWPAIEAARSDGATIVVIDPLRTATAQAADWFVQPLPGTDVALMLAMMHVLIRDGLVDREYVDAHTVGFEDLVSHVAEWTPQRASALCGVPATEIETLAQYYGEEPRSFIRSLVGPEHHANGAMFFRTLACLPTLTGAWRHRGGGLARSVGSWSSVDVDESVFDGSHLWPGGVAPRSLQVNHLGRALTHERLDPPIASLVVWNANPAVTAPRAALVRQGLAREDLFAVVSEQFLTDTAAYADVVLPATTQIEHLDVVASWGHLYLGWNEPAIPPRGEAIPNTELWRRLAEAMGFEEPELFSSDAELLHDALSRVDLDTLRRDGFIRLSLPEDLQPYAQGGPDGPGGVVGLRSHRLEAAGLAGLPTFVAPERIADTERPLALMTAKVHTRFLNSSYSPLPGHGDREGEPFVEIDPRDADARGIASGDLVRVHSRHGSLELPALVPDRSQARVRPGVVLIPFGWWRAQHLDGGCANDLTGDTLTDWGGGVGYYDVAVEVERLDP